jgi:hypothetical protein
MLLDNYENGVKYELSKLAIDDFQKENIIVTLAAKRKTLDSLPQKIKTLKNFYGIKNE